MTHGHPTTYRRGCRCEVCVQANRDYQREWYRRRMRGDTARVPVGPVAKHIARLSAAGMSYAAIDSAAAIGRGTARGAASGLHVAVRRDNADAILGVTLLDAPKSHRQWTSTRPLRGLVQEMVDAKLTGREMQNKAKLYPHRILKKDRVTQRTRERVILLYRYYARLGIVPAERLNEVSA